MEIHVPVISKIRLNATDQQKVAIGFITSHLLGYDGSRSEYTLPYIDEKKKKIMVEGNFPMGDELLELGESDDQELLILINALNIIAKSNTFKGPIREPKRNQG